MQKITIDGMTMWNTKIKDNSRNMKIARWIIGISAWFMFVCLLQLVTTWQATRVADYKVANSFVPVINH